ncbi:PaaI family thioesterase [Brevibacillus choshinensis]|uniref:PaaI family thioesterase n=1 Tax=Brevibacillus choshinensis TaxID=54911 RepID=UPI002E230476|nr:PaaI family thioesterase [Brevibacillus choshinensis]
MSVDRERFLQILQRPRYHQFLNLSLEAVEEGYVKLRLPFREELLGDEADSYIHGGVIAALIDIAGDFALITVHGKGLPTVDLRVDYLRPGRKEDLIATATIVKNGRSLGISDIVVENETGQKIAVGRALYSTQ